MDERIQQLFPPDQISLPRVVAVKEIRVGTMNDAASKDNATRLNFLKNCFSFLQHAVKKELYISKQVSHENVVRSLGSFEIVKGECWGLAMELCRGSLDDLARRDRDLGLQEVAALQLQVVRGLRYLHGQQIVHRYRKVIYTITAKNCEQCEVIIPSAKSSSPSQRPEAQEYPSDHDLGRLRRHRLDFAPRLRGDTEAVRLQHLSLLQL